MLTKDTPIGEIFSLLNSESLMHMAESNAEIVELVWNYCKENSRVPQLHYLIAEVLPTNNENYINEFMEVLIKAASMGEYYVDNENNYILREIIKIVKILERIPDCMFPYFLSADLAPNSYPTKLIIKFGTCEHLRTVKIKILEQKYLNEDEAIAYFISLINGNRKNINGIYDLNDFYSDLPDEYQIGAII